MPDYIDIEDIPGGPHRKYPWGEWAAIPEGKALEVTEVLDGVAPHIFCAGGVGMAERRGLKLSYRGKRVFIRKEKQS